MIRLIYNLLIGLVFILALPVGLILALFVEKRGATFGPRLGFQDYPSQNKPIWVHGLSVGEINAAIPLVQALARHYPDKPVVVSASTMTGFETAKANLKDVVAGLFYFPYDLPWSVARAFKRVDPSLCILVESDIWPNFIAKAKERNIPLILANGRLSDSSLAGYRRLFFLMAPLFRAFDRIGVQSPLEVDRFKSVGARPESLHVSGNLKFDRPPVPDLAPLETLPEFNGPVLVAGSTHPGEESLLAGLLKDWKAKHGLSMIVAPRDPKRAQEVADIFSREGLSASLYSHPQEAVDVVVVDSMGVLAALYARGDLCFVGGSLEPFGGHNPLEPAVLEKPVLFGPDMKDFHHMASMMLDRGAARQVMNATDLGYSVSFFLEKPELAREMADRATEVIRDNLGAVEKTLELTDSLLSWS